jgi:hypothetical protein
LTQRESSWNSHSLLQPHPHSSHGAQVDKSYFTPSTVDSELKKMTRLVNCKTEIEYAGPAAQELKSFEAPGRWTKEKSAAFVALMQRLKNDGYTTFNSSVHTIGLQRNGQSAIYHVPSGQRGGLAAYAGKHVHIVCVARTDAYSGRMFAVSEVSETGQVMCKA